MVGRRPGVCIDVFVNLGFGAICAMLGRSYANAVYGLFTGTLGVCAKQRADHQMGSVRQSPLLGARDGVCHALGEPGTRGNWCTAGRGSNG